MKWQQFHRFAAYCVGINGAIKANFCYLIVAVDAPIVHYCLIVLVANNLQCETEIGK